MPKRRKAASRLKGRLFASIKSNAQSATQLRLAGRLGGAASHEQDVDNCMRVAVRHGWGDAAQAAEFTGIARGMAAGPKYR